MKYYKLISFLSRVSMQFLGTLYMHAYSMRNGNKFFMAIKNTLEENFYRVDYITCHGQKFLTGVLTRDLFAVAKYVMRYN